MNQSTEKAMNRIYVYDFSELTPDQQRQSVKNERRQQRKIRRQYSAYKTLKAFGLLRLARFIFH